VGLTIVYSQIARRDASEIYNYISRDSVYYAKREIKLIKAAVKKLKLQPLLGKKFKKSEDENTRELIFRNYRIIYDIVGNKKIIILSIHHHSRSLANNPAFKDED
jgi:toxin ParE1/3/4